MKKVLIIDSEPVLNAPMGRFLPREIVVKLYPESNIQRLKYIFKYNTAKEVPECEAIELLQRFPSMSLVEPEERKYERIEDFELTGEEKRKDLTLIVKRLLLKCPFPPPKNVDLIDMINGQLAIGNYPLSEEGMEAYEKDVEIAAKKRREEINIENRERNIEMGIGFQKEGEDVNIS